MEPRFKVGDRVFYWFTVEGEVPSYPPFPVEPPLQYTGTVLEARSDGFCTVKMDDGSEYPDVFEEEMIPLSDYQSMFVD